MTQSNRSWARKHGVLMLLAAALVAFSALVLPARAYAAGELHVGGQDLTNEELANGATGDGWSWDGKTLTLNGYDGAAYEDSGVIVADEDLTIALAGDNYLLSSVLPDRDSDAHDVILIGIETFGNLTITGSGSLAINADYGAFDSDTSYALYGIFTSDLLIDGAAVRVDLYGLAADEDNEQYGMIVNGSLRIINGAAVDIYSSVYDADDDTSIVVNGLAVWGTDDSSITGSSLGVSGTSGAMIAGGNLSIKDSDVSLTTDKFIAFNLYEGTLTLDNTDFSALTWDEDSPAVTVANIVTRDVDGDIEGVEYDNGLLTLADGGSSVDVWRTGTVAMHRLYNPNSGEHFYTGDVDEADYLVEVGWVYEGVGWTAPSKSRSSVPVYRLYNAVGGEHHYTMSADERDYLKSVGWTDEGIGWYSDEGEGVTLLREYNPNMFSCNHNYTTDRGEHDYLVSIGWRDEGAAWYGVSGVVESPLFLGYGIG